MARKPRYKVTPGGVQAVGQHHKPGRQYNPHGQPVNPNAGNGGGNGGNGGNGGGGGGGGGGSTPSAKPDIYDLDGQLGNPDVVRDLVRRLLRGQYRPQIRGAKRDIRQVGSAFDDYRNQLQAIQARQAGVYGQVMNQMGQFGAQIDAPMQGTQAPVAGMSPSMQTTQQAQQAQAVRTAMLGNMGGLMGNQALAQNNYLANRQASSIPLEIRARQEARARLQDVRDEKGASRVEILDTLRQARDQQREANRNYKLVKQEFGLDKAKAAVDAADTVADNERDERQDRLDRREERRERRQERRQERREVLPSGYTRAEWQRMTPEQRRAALREQANFGDDPEDKPKGGLDPEDRQASRKTRAEVRDLFQRYRDTPMNIYGDPEDPKKVTGTRPPTDDEILQRISGELNLSTAEARIYIKLARGRGLNPAERKEARRLGIAVPPRLRRPNDPRDRPGVGGH